MTWEQIQPLVACTLAGKALTGQLEQRDALYHIHMVCNQPTMKDAVTELVHAPSSAGNFIALQEISRLK